MKKKLLLILLCILQSVLFALQAQNTQRNIAYTDDNVRFTVISDGALRLEYALDGEICRRQIAHGYQSPVSSSRLQTENKRRMG